MEGAKFGNLAVMLLMLTLDMRRRFKAVMDVLDSLIRNGFPLLIQLSSLFSGTRSLLLGLFILLRWMIFILFPVLALVIFIILLQDEKWWSVKFDVRDLGGHLDTAFRGWSSTQAARVRLVISRLFFLLSLWISTVGSGL